MNREEQIKKAHDLLSEGKFEEARSLVDAIKKHDAEELEHKASEEQPEEDKTVEETKDEEKAEQIPEIMESRDRKLAGRTLPAHGLCLIKVEY